jgi:hypothetical protein
MRYPEAARVSRCEGLGTARREKLEVEQLLYQEARWLDERRFHIPQ